MAPIRDFLCMSCGHEWEDIVRIDSAVPCPHCESHKVEKLPALVGGYQMSSGGGSTRPRHAGSFKSKEKK